MPRRLLCLLLSFVFAVVLQACSVGRYAKQLFGARIHVSVEVDSKANMDNPIALDILLVHDKKLFRELLRMTAREWFQKKDQIIREYQVLGGIEVWEWEWAPGEKVPLLEIPYRASAMGGLAFGDYGSQGAHRVRIDPHDSIFIRLDVDGFTVMPLDQVSN